MGFDIKRRVLIIGNGFDLDLGRKTTYKDFYNSEYCPKKYPAPLIEYLNNQWNNNLDTVRWYDLENALGQYYETIKANNEEPKDIFNKQEKELIEMIHTQHRISRIYDKEYDYLRSKGLVKSNSNNTKVELIYPELVLPPSERDMKAMILIKEGLIKYLKETQNNSINEKSIAYSIIPLFFQEQYKGHTSIYSFNYTTLDFCPTTKLMLQYVHGNIEDDNIIIGTKDGDMNSQYDFLQKPFDSQYNPPKIVYNLSQADNITIFGHSLGENDSQYFKTFFETQSSGASVQGKTITIITKDEDSERAIKRSLQEMSNRNLSNLFSLNDLYFIRTDDYKGDKEFLIPILNRISFTPPDITLPL